MEIGQADCRGSEVGNKDLAGNVQTLEQAWIIVAQCVFKLCMSTQLWLGMKIYMMLQGKLGLGISIIGTGNSSRVGSLRYNWHSRLWSALVPSVEQLCQAGSSECSEFKLEQQLCIAKRRIDARLWQMQQRKVGSQHCWKKQGSKPQRKTLGLEPSDIWIHL